MSENLSVKTRYGTFNGFVDEKGVKNWLGIPFAQPPVGKLRWQAPQPLQPSDKTFDAKKLGFAPIQEAIKIDKFTEDASAVQQSEDCLTLNIWKRGEGKNKPVMVWIYGGAFLNGYAHEPAYNGSNFVSAHDVIFVSINYRLNIFGFMNLAAIDKNFEDSGYLGIKDQIAALEWIKENIAEFGGDPENITVFGESAGSASIFLITVALNTKNLFQKVIGQSGALGMYNTPEISAQLAEKFMQCSGTKKISDLIKKSPDELKNIYKKATEDRKTNIMDLLPVCDGKFLPKNPLKAFKDGAARGIKFLTGNTADEWRAFLIGGENLFKIFRAEPKKLSPAMQRYNEKTPEEIYKSWLKNRDDTEENFIDFVNNLDWRIGQELSVEYQSKFDDVYLYLFSQQSENEILRSCHALDLSYTFDAPYIDQNYDRNFAKVIQTTWVAFAKNGNPDNEFIPHWEKYIVNNRQTMELNSKGCVLHKDLNTENLNALRYVYEN